MNTRIRAWGIGLLLGLAGCHRASLEVSSGVEGLCHPLPAKVRAGDPLCLDYRWTLPPGKHPLPKGYTAFVHFVDPGGVLLFADDHTPIPGPNTWEPGKTYSYRRFLIVPDLPTGKVEIRVGLFSGPNRLPLEGTQRGRHEYVAGELELLPPDGKVKLLYGTGWYPPEALPGDPFVKRRWMGKEASVNFRNRGQDVLVFVEAETTYLYPQAPQLMLSIGGATVKLPIAGKDLFLARARFRAHSLGGDRWSELHLAVSQSFVPSLVGLGSDTRELGLWVHGLRVMDVADLAAPFQEGIGAASLGKVDVTPPLAQEGPRGQLTTN